MSDSLSTDISDLIKMLDAEGPLGDEAPVRLLVATDWSDAAVPLALLKAFRAIVHPDSPLQLTFAVPHEPAASDAECVHVLTEGAGQPGELRGLEVVSFDQALGEPYDCAVVPTGDASLLITEVAGMVVRMHDLERRQQSEEHTAPGNPGDAGALRRRLNAFAAGSC